MPRLSALLILVGLGVLALVVYVQLDRSVSRVLVTGPLDNAERQQIREVVHLSLDGGILSADVAGLQDAIMGLSWPRAVTIRRAWPASFEINVEKPAVVARWQDAYISSDGKIVRLPGDRSDLPVFDCAFAEPKAAMEVYQRLSAPSLANGLAISRLTENVLGEWLLTLTPSPPTSTGRLDLEVVLGAERLMERLDRFLLVYRKAIRDRHDEIARVDARYDNGVAVGWRTDTLVASTASFGTKHGQR
ncbi:MAG: FtsQ-type POTRA domain-containing protein [Gammaproteobacteria bacterium]